MQVPDEFKPIFRRFDQSISYLYPSFEEAVASIVNVHDAKLKARFASYLDELISGSYSLDELDSVWKNSSAEVFISGGGALQIFKLMRSLMD